jgi:hypothetical protein
MTLCLIGVAMQATALYFARRSKNGMPTMLVPAKVVAPSAPRERPAATAPTAPGPFSLTAHLPPLSAAPHLRRQPAAEKPSSASSQVRPGLLTKTEKVSFVR